MENGILKYDSALCRWG